MTSKSVPHKRQKPPPPGLKQLAFAFPFLRKAQGNARASAQFTDEHEIYRLLAASEPSGAYLVSRKGMWHGGIHITEAGAGQALDLDAGLRCLAEGVLVAYRADSDYPISEVSVDGSNVPLRAPYSTGFALVRHEMEFPRGTKLTFYTLYMHLMSNADYESNFPKRQKPAYWSRQWRVTQYAQDKPLRGRAGQLAAPSQVGLHVRKTPNGSVLGILPQGASVSIGKTETVQGAAWGQVTHLNGATLCPPEAGGYVAPSVAINGWIYLGTQNGGPVAEERIPESNFDRVIVTTDQTCSLGDPQGIQGGVPIKAGDLIGHLGRYDSLNGCTSGTRMAHIEVFCDDSIQPFLEQGRAWVNQHGPHKEDWAAVGLPSGPTILRIAPGTVLCQRTEDNKFVPGADPQSRKTDAVQVYSLAELARDPNRRVPEPHPHPDPGWPVSWWHVDGVNAQGQKIDGWVCDFNHPGGRVTPEFAQKWIDFECLADAHDPAHTIFATTRKWVDYASGANVADPASRSNLSPLMLRVYDALFTKGDGKHAADELCMLSQTERGGYPWLMQAASRLIVRHESEWANPSKWKQLIAELEKQTGPRPQHEEEQKRIDKLVWWNEVAAGVSGFPGSDVYHINPIGLVGNFGKSSVHPFISIQGQRIELQFLLKSDGQPLNEKDYADAAAELGCEMQAIKAVAKTETGSSGPYFKPGHDLASRDDQVPAILFERHLFHRATHGEYDQSHPHISNSIQGGYGNKAVQYEKLTEAYALNSNAALLSASWGRFQILGSNFGAAGFKNVQDYVASMSESEANQLRAFVSFIKADSALNRAISSKDWHGFAVRYNGPAQQGYDAAIARNYRELSGQ
ncbi:hypothetical protein OKW43_002255 [Paraburkholderia sp. WC7.3g]|uniref:N-acetylmuramidase family protein n=1 Tax=Paraburkholderia sp. WC7.3g TaxID=2991070 RepID=UPI003D256310